MSLVLEVGKIYLTRNGQRRKVLSLSAVGAYPVVVQDPGSANNLSFRRENGRMFNSMEDPLDLIKEDREPVVVYGALNEEGRLVMLSAMEEFIRARVTKGGLKFIKLVEEKSNA